MAELRNWKHELVARALAVGKSPEDASAAATYPVNASAFRNNARKRATLPDIRRRVAELRAPGIAAAAEALPGIRAAARAAGLRPPPSPPPSPPSPPSAVSPRTEGACSTGTLAAGEPAATPSPAVDPAPADPAVDSGAPEQPRQQDVAVEREINFCGKEDQHGTVASEQEIAAVAESQQREILVAEEGVTVTVEWILQRCAELASYNADDYLSEPDPVTGERYFDLSRVPREKLARLTDVAQVIDEHGGSFKVRHTKVKGDVVQALMLMAKLVGMREDPVANASLGERLDRAMARERQLLAAPAPLVQQPARSPPPPPASAPSTPPSDSPPSPADPPSDPPKPSDHNAPPDSLDELIRRRAAPGTFVAGGFDWVRNETPGARG